MGDTLFGQSGSPEFGEGTESPFASSYLLAKQGSKVQPERIKVAAYVRVSTLSDEQEDSLENQTAHYSKYIRSNPNWKMTMIYTDHGKSGTLTSGRSGFNRLIRHALEGKVELILCKSVSRFARNVLDTLNTVRMLKEHGVRVIFEKEDIDTESMQSEFILTMMAAVAQEESRSISENIKWANKKRLERGEPRFRRLLGYKQTDNREWAVHKEEAEIVKEAFDLCLKGMTPAEIARNFIRKGYETTKGNKEWSGTAIREILKNITYVGDVLGQKMYSKDHISHTTTRNQGEKTQYLIENHHDPIVDKETFNKAQQILKQRSKPRQKGKKKHYPLSSRIVCGYCGANLQRFVCRGIVTWRCGRRTKSQTLCKMDGIREEEILEAIKLAVKEYYFSTNDKGTPIKAMIKNIKNLEMSADVEYNQLRLELERVLFEENMALLNSTTSKFGEWKTKRLELEGKIQERDIWWGLLDQDFDYRKKSMEKLESLAGTTSISELERDLEDIEFLRAWVVRVKALSPISFSISFVTGEEMEVNLERRYYQ